MIASVALAVPETWPDAVDVVLVMLLAICAAVGLIDLTRRVLSRWRR